MSSLVTQCSPQPGNEPRGRKEGTSLLPSCSLARRKEGRKGAVNSHGSQQRSREISSPGLVSAAAFLKTPVSKQNPRPCGGEEFQREVLELLQGLGRPWALHSQDFSSVSMLLTFKARMPWLFPGFSLAGEVCEPHKWGWEAPILPGDESWPRPGGFCVIPAGLGDAPCAPLLLPLPHEWDIGFLRKSLDTDSAPSGAGRSKPGQIWGVCI